MNFIKLLAFLGALAFVVSHSSCSKEKETTIIGSPKSGGVVAFVTPDADSILVVSDFTQDTLVSFFQADIYRMNLNQNDTTGVSWKFPGFHDTDCVTGANSPFLGKECWIYDATVPGNYCRVVGDCNPVPPNYGPNVKKNVCFIKWLIQ